MKRNSNVSMIERYAKVKFNKGYKRHPCSLFGALRKFGYFKEREKVKKSYIPKDYDTPKELGKKWQMDVKYVPTRWYLGEIADKFYQYTIIDEANRERFIHPFKEQSSYSTVEFAKMAVDDFGYQPEVIQTANGFIFNHFKVTASIHPNDKLSNE